MPCLLQSGCKSRGIFIKLQTKSTLILKKNSKKLIIRERLFKEIRSNTERERKKGEMEKEKMTQRLREKQNTGFRIGIITFIIRKEKAESGKNKREKAWRTKKKLKLQPRKLKV